MRQYTLVLMQIALLIGMTISNIHFISESNITITNQDKNIFSKILEFIDVLPSVSALDESDASAGVATCVNTKSGATCQEFPASECAAQCDGVCIPSSKNNVQQCKPGTCYSPVQGSCQYGAPQISCQQNGGQWFDSPNGNIPQCKRGCCILGEQTAFTTAQECTAMSAQLGTAKVFKPEVTTELACLSLAGGSAEGACVIERDGENTCRFGTRTQCTQLRGEFHEGYLCSAPALQTNCVRQASASCAEGKEEIYWFDSCGNRENIYSANKEQSWNNGRILNKANSCSLASGNDLDANKATCGNCNYLLGTKCGAKTSTEKVADNSINFVCRDLSCVDENGKERKNGESWCSYQSSIGVDNGRSTDAVGSRHFRKVCINGDVKTEPCQDFRNGICVESKDNSIPGGFSSAACRLNTWQQCINYNFENATSKCTQNPDCFLNNVKVGPSYEFNVCAPKYNPGFDLINRPEGSELTCSIANNKCTVLYVKKLRGLKTEWVCEKNCECETAAYTEKMNNLCMSLGDCGAKVNTAGKVTENYRISNAPRLSNTYLSGIARYKDPVPGKVAAPGNFTATSIDTALGLPSEIDAVLLNENEKALQFALNTVGAAGGAVLIASLIPGGASGSLSAGALYVFGKVPGLGALHKLPMTNSLSPSLASYGGAFAGAAIGLAVVSILLKVTGVGLGVSEGVAYTLMAAGAAGGAVIGYNLVTTGGIFGSGGFAGILAWGPWLAIGAGVIVGVLKIVGVGDTKEVIVEFQCQPWQAPTGGVDCKQCGKNGVPCSKYACQSLGQTCQLVNEGTESQACVEVSPQDVAAPVINPWEGVLSESYSYTDVSNEGFSVRGKEECIPAYTSFTLGIELNEAAQCKFDTKHTNSYKEMEFSFGGRNLYVQNHSMTLSVPSLESLGLADTNSQSTADYNLFVRCQDKNGNANVREYNVKFCIKQGNDITPPVIVRGSPLTDDVAFNAVQENITVFVNEPATCRIDTNDVAYDSMATDMRCFSNATQQSAFGFACDTTVALPQNISTFYIRCSDQPWLNATDYEQGKKHNQNTQSLVMSLKKTARQLRIDSLEPSNKTVSSSVYPASVEIIARTSGGVDNGRAVCYVNISNSWHRFMDSDSATHRQVFNQLSAGNKSVSIECMDRVGNKAQANSRFSVLIDNIIPAITRVYADDNNLFVVTDENSECRFSNKACEFEFDQGQAMSGIDKVHTTILDRNKDYFVMCKDRLDNKAGQCQITVREGRLI